MEETKVLIGNSFCQDWAEGGLGKLHIRVATYNFPTLIFALFAFFTPIVDAQMPLL